MTFPPTGDPALTGPALIDGTGKAQGPPGIDGGPCAIYDGPAPADLSPVRHVLLGMNAHINYDLPQALLAVITDREFADPALLARREADHRAIDEVLAALQAMIVRLAPSEIVTFGTGLGGHAALIFGVLLGARRIVAVEPAAHLIGDVLARYNDRRWQRELAALPDPATATRYVYAESEDAS